MTRARAEPNAAIDRGAVGVGALLACGDDILALGHNEYAEAGDLTAHGEIVVLRKAARRLGAPTGGQRAQLTLYVTLEPCLMCLVAVSFVGIKRLAYSALIEDVNDESILAHGLTCDQLNPLLTRGPLTLIPGIRHDDGRAVLARPAPAPRYFEREGLGASSQSPTSWANSSGSSS